MNVEDLKSVMDGFDPASLLPELEAVLGTVGTAVRFATLLGPVLLLVMGLAYLLLAPREANYIFGYRCAFGMGSVEAWRFTQRLAGVVWAGLGLVLTIVMFSLTGKFAGQEVSQVIRKAVKYVLWEVGLTALACLAINTAVMFRFTYSGDYRKDRAGK